MPLWNNNICLGINGIIFANDPNQTSSSQGQINCLLEKGTAKETSNQPDFQKHSERLNCKRSGAAARIITI
ncbi:MAG: hypothetical protein JO297_08620 [Nitrososphaeraceae archaeon]|nr:hypothetical protein [Nitrososphaeraceae archaeon]